MLTTPKLVQIAVKILSTELSNFPVDENDRQHLRMEAVSDSDQLKGKKS
jgi:hypothetical protein